ncbi:MAG: NAD-dependent epimerase/dehydratase family protein [Bacteriovoracaceae bacterium]|nr:NAD-dependent epimerase/dehydratase family protein [Bacteriovoracaceae bacterium]
MKKIAVAGASGFVGSALISYLLEHTDFEIIALSRRGKDSPHPRIKYLSCDLFSMLDCERALENVDAAFYLVHSMLPSAKLTQGNFEDFDLIMADNFAKAAIKNSLKQIIYLGGIIPSLYELTRHLISRLEVEEVLSTIKSSHMNFTSLRSGIILGPNGSSYTMMERLVNRLPILICPRWTTTLSSPISIKDVVIALHQVLVEEKLQNKIYDLSGTEVMSYRQMLSRLALKFKKLRLFINVPFFSPGLTKLWVTLITQAPKNLVYPLIASLSAHVVPDPERKFPFKHTQKNFEEIIDEIQSEQSPNLKGPNAFNYSGLTEKSEVRSVQRLHTFFRTTANKIGNIYFQWMGKKFYPFINTTHYQKNGGEFISVNLFFVNVSLLILEYSKERSNEDRALFYIRGGMLAKKEGRGRFEFRNIAHSRYTVAAIHEFAPTLPWFIYKYTQALLHIVVMKSFDRYLTDEKL